MHLDLFELGLGLELEFVIERERVGLELEFVGLECGRYKLDDAALSYVGKCC